MQLAKKAIIFKILGLIFFVIVIILLVFLIKNQWNIGDGINEFIEFVGVVKNQTTSK